MIKSNEAVGRRRRPVESSGFTLIEIMIALGVMSVSILLMSQMFISQSKQQKGVLQKAETIDAKTSIEAMMTNGSNCPCQFEGLTFNGSLPSASIAGVPALAASCNPGAPILATAGAVFPTSQTQMKISTIGVTNIVPTGNPNEYTGQVQVSFDTSTTTIPFKPVLIPIVLIAAGPPASRSIASCSSTGSGGGGGGGPLTCGGATAPTSNFIEANGGAVQVLAGGVCCVDGGEGMCGPNGYLGCTTSGWTCMSLAPPASGGGDDDDGG